jgi:hypothetical protein
MSTYLQRPTVQSERDDSKVRVLLSQKVEFQILA